MKISTKGRYALRLMLDVALHSHGTAVPLRDVAQRQDISDKYLEQIVTQLSREPEEYTVGEILRVLEGNLAPVSCADADDVCRCGRADQCVTVEIWREIQAAVSGVVDHVTLADLVRRHHEKCPGDGAEA